LIRPSTQTGESLLNQDATEKASLNAGLSVVKVGDFLSVSLLSELPAP
jgi:hypothetical protein